MQKVFKPGALLAVLAVMFAAWWVDQYLAQAELCKQSTNGKGRLQTKPLDVRAHCVVPMEGGGYVVAR